MSSVSRAGPRGGKGAAKMTDTSGSGSKQKTDTKSDSTKSSDLNPKSQPTAEQMRIAQIFDTSKTDDIKHKIKQVMDATRKSEDEVCTALYDCDNDLDRAVNMLLEGEGQGEWVTSGNKKKNRHPGTTVASTRGEKSDGARDRSEPGETGADRERSRTRGGGPPRMRGRGSSDSRGWRGRENKENEKNLQEGEGSRDGPPRRGGGGRMMNGPGRSGRGGRGGRPGPRTFQSREKGGPGFPRSIDTWNNPHGEAEPAETPTNGPDYGGGENWDDGFPSPEDWDNEEYTGSLADTKVFTASAGVSSHMGGQSSADQRQDTSNSDLAAAASSLPVISANNSLETAASMLPPNLTGSMPVGQVAQQSKSLTPAQSQYLSQLASQTSMATENLKAAVGMGTAPGASNGPKEPTSYVSAVNAGSYASSAAAQYQASTPAPTYTATTVSYAATTYGNAAANYKGPAANMAQHQQQQAPQQQQNMQSRPKNQRPRVPPPSKIPSSAVEMPGDAANSNIGFLDVQFGGLEFGSDSNSFDFTSNSAANESVNKYQSSTAVSGHESSQQVGNNSVGVPLDLSSMGMNKAQQQPQVQQQAQQTVSGLESYSSASSNQQSQVSTGQSMTSATQHAKDLSQASSLSAAISHSQKLGDSMTFPSQVSEHKSQQANVASSYSQSRGGGASSGNSAALDMVKSETSSSTLSYPNSSTSNNASYQSSYQKPSNVYQSANYSSSSVNNSGSGGGGGSGTTGYSQGNSSAGNQYQTNQQNQNSGYSSSQTGYNSQTFPSSSAQPPSTSYSQTSGSSSASYHQTQSNTSYQSSSSYPTMSQPSAVSSSYPSSQQYQASSQQQQQQQQSYSATGGSTNYTPAASSTTASQYQNSYGSNGPVTTATGLHAASSASAKLGSSMGSTSSKDSQYDTPSTVASSSLGSSSVQGSSSATPAALGLVSSAGQAGSNTASTKVTSSTAGVPPAMLGQHQYIMGQQGMPYFNVQQPIYGFEDYQHQLMQSRVPMQTASGFYDLSSLAGRESGMTSVAYSVSDGRFARTDNNSSPVPSTLSQQQNPTQAHQQPMLNPSTLPPGYAYFYGTNVVPGAFQYGTPALYQLPAATNAHGATNSTQYAKPATYSSGYGSGYDSLSGQGTADYSKPSGGYVSTGSQGGQSSKGSVVGSAGSSASATATASDLSSNMYGKAHVALNKVNSYDKQGFHSGTPPPFSLPGSQTNQMGAATGYAPLFIPTLATHQQLHQPLHQDSGSGSGQRSQPSSQQSKSGVKPTYNTSYWAQN